MHPSVSSVASNVVCYYRAKSCALKLLFNTILLKTAHCLETSHDYKCTVRVYVDCIYTIVYSRHIH